ncbi:unnamed protein product [Hymenolepis diminuta]|uniref:Uncharacterized protein n=1 Tax=Hymenolepis diminuta TaxID=6216 RepID=A0A564XUM8_HYMDI|nr:unnamed protein product [Hymenolepis diminuta]
MKELCMNMRNPSNVISVKRHTLRLIPSKNTKRNAMYVVSGVLSMAIGQRKGRV